MDFKRYGWKKIAPIILKALPLRQQSLQRLCRSDSNRSKGFAPERQSLQRNCSNANHSNGIAPTTITPTELLQRQSLQRICSSGNHFNTSHSSGGCSKGIRFKSSFCFSGICQLSVPLRSLIFSSSSLMTIGHKAGHYCHFRVPSVDSDTGRKKKTERKKGWNLLGGE